MGSNEPATRRGRRLTKEDVVRAIHRGVLYAHDHFQRLSGDASWMADNRVPGLECLVVSHIFRAITNHESMKARETPVLELPVSYIRQWTGAKGRGRTRANIRPLKRVDIALLNRKDRPIHLIEVKQKWKKKTGYADVEKLRDILVTYGPRNDGTLKSVFLSVYWQAHRRRPYLDEKLDDVETEVKKMLGGSEAVRVGFHRDVASDVRKDGKEWEYGSHIIEMSRRNRKKE